MTTFNGPEVIIEKYTNQELFEKLSNLNNLKNILPEKIKNFRSEENTCSFQMEGISELKLSISKKIPYFQISLIALDSPIKFILECHISEKNGKSHAQLEVNAELNMITKMMVEKPIKDFINVLSEKLKFI